MDNQPVENQFNRRRQMDGVLTPELLERARQEQENFRQQQIAYNQQHNLPEIREPIILEPIFIPPHPHNIGNDVAPTPAPVLVPRDQRPRVRADNPQPTQPHRIPPNFSSTDTTPENQG